MNKSLTLQQFGVYHKKGLGFQRYICRGIFFMFNGLRRDVIVSIVDIGRIVDHDFLNFLNFLFIIKYFLREKNHILITHKVFKYHGFFLIYKKYKGFFIAKRIYFYVRRAKFLSPIKFSNANIAFNLQKIQGSLL